MIENLTVKRVENGFLLEVFSRLGDVKEDDYRYEDKTFIFTKPNQVVQAIKTLLNQKGE